MLQLLKKIKLIQSNWCITLIKFDLVIFIYQLLKKRANKRVKFGKMIFVVKTSI